MKRWMLCGLVVSLHLSIFHLSCAAQRGEEEILETKVKGVMVEPQSDTPVVVLEDIKEHRAFPIWIGVPEARAIALEMEGAPTPRPLTHTLLHNILTDLQVNVARIIITDVRDNTFYASILLQQGAKTLTIDSRPSDAIALALRAKAPIFVAKKVLGAVRTIIVETSPSLPSPARTLGMHIQSLDTNLAGFFQLANTDGVLVSSVDAGGQAESQGVRRGDIITAVDGQPVKDMQGFLTLCKDKKIGQEVLLHVTREQKPLTIRLMVSSLQ